MQASTYPPVSFFFDVVFLGNFQDDTRIQAQAIPTTVNLAQEPVETRFQSVTGLSVEMQTESFKEGGETRFEHTLPVRTKYNPLVLKRGLIKDSKMVKWCMDAMINFDIHPMDLLVRLLHVKRSDPKQPPDNIEPLMSWQVINAWPRKWSISDFNAEQNALAIESLELNYSYFKSLQ